MPTISVYGSSGQPNLNGLKNPAKCLWRWEPDRRSNFFFSPPAHLCAVTYMTEISLSVTLNNKFNSTQLNLNGKIPTGSPWEAHSTAHWAADFFIFGSSGLPTEFPTELPTVSIYGSSGQSNLHVKIPTGSPLRCPRVAHGQRIGQLPCFFRMGLHETFLSLITKHFAKQLCLRTFVNFLFRGFCRPPCRVPLQVQF